jgi:hypothetical protein
MSDRRRRSSYRSTVWCRAVNNVFIDVLQHSFNFMHAVNVFHVPLHSKQTKVQRLIEYSYFLQLLDRDMHII